MSTAAKISLTMAVILGGVAYMIITTLRSGEALEYFKHVDEVMASPAAWQGRRLQLHGNVVAGSIVKRQGALDFRFALHRGRHWVDVSYHGVVPDAFRDCAELIVHGELGTGPIFTAQAISAKCPSKYEGQRQPDRCGAEFREQVLAARNRR